RTSLRNLPIPLRVLLCEIFLCHFVCFFAKSSCTTSSASSRNLPVPLRVLLCELFLYHFVCFFANSSHTTSCASSRTSSRPLPVPLRVFLHDLLNSVLIPSMNCTLRLVLALTCHLTWFCMVIHMKLAPTYPLSCLL